MTQLAHEPGKLNSLLVREFREEIIEISRVFHECLLYKPSPFIGKVHKHHTGVPLAALTANKAALL